MRDDLLGYLLGALDAHEHQRVEEELRASPALRRELERLRRFLEPLEDARDDVEPPAGLARRTLAFVEDSCVQAAQRREPRAVARSWQLGDFIVASLTGLVVITMAFPALVNSRYRTQIDQCQWNLSRLGTQLISYAMLQSDQSYPEVAEFGKMAFVGQTPVQLVEAGLLERDTNLIYCPGDLADGSRQLGIPERSSLVQACGPRLDELRRQAGGSYAWYIGTEADNHLQPVRHLGRTHFAIMADSPSFYLPELRSDHHGRAGFNVLFDDMHVEFLRLCRDGSRRDDPLRNHYGVVGPGVSENDACVAPSHVQPFPGRQ